MRHIIRKRKSSMKFPLYQETKACSFSHRLHPVPAKQADDNIRLWWNAFYIQQRLSHVDWLAGKGSSGWIRKTLPPCPHWEIGTTSHGGKHEQGQGLQALWNTTLEAVDLSYAQRKTSKIHSAKSTDFLIPDFCFKNACLCVYNIEKGRIQTFSASFLSKMRFFFSFILLCTDFLFLPKRKDIIFELIIFNFQRTKAKKLLQSQVLNERSAGKGPAQGRQCGPLHKDAWGSTGAVGRWPRKGRDIYKGEWAKYLSSSYFIIQHFL